MSGWPRAGERARHALTHSIKGRLVALFLLLALGTVVVFLLGMQRLLQNGWQAYAGPLVADYVDRLVAEIGTPPDPARALALTDRLPIWVRIEGPRVELDTQPPRRGLRHDGGREPGVDAAADGWLVRHTDDGHRISLGLAHAPSNLRPRLIGWTTLAALLLLTAMAYATTRRLLAPLKVIHAGVAAYGRGDFSTPIRVLRGDELGHLADDINGMAANLSGMLEAQRTLLLALSHELRSPLTRARVNAELVDEGPARSALLRDLGEMRDLIADLLEGERLAQGPATLQLATTDLPALVRDVVAAQFADRPLQLQLEGAPGMLAVDAPRMRMLLRNLIDNALRHSAGAAAVPEVYLRTEADGRIALGVRDHGPGVASDELRARLGQPFYRPDSARARSSGGVGLGLYLCRRVAEAHGGKLRIRAAEPGFDVSVVWLPLHPASAAAAARW